MAQRRKSAISKADTVTSAVKAIEASSKKQLGKIHALRTAEEEALQSELERVKKELEIVKAEDPNSPSWADQALGIADHMKSIVRRESELQHQLLLKTDEVAKELEMRVRPIRKELPTILDFSEEDRVHLNLLMNKALQEVAKKRTEIVEDEARLQKQMSVLIHNTPDLAAPKEMVISKLKTAFETITLANDPEMVTMDVLAHIDSAKNSNEKKESPTKSLPKKSPDKNPTGQKKV